MYSSVYSGLLIVFEGIDGAGKTTQAHMLKHELERAGLEVVISKEPTDGPWGQRIRKSAATGRLPLDEELHAFVEDRKEHVRDLIWPALTAGKVVILDRYYYSTMAYQGQRGADVDGIKEAMLEVAPIPDMVVLIDLDPNVSMLRIAESRGDIPNEFEKVESLSTVRTIFNQIAEADGRVWKLDGSLSIDAVHTTIIQILVGGPLSEKCARPAEDAEDDGPSHEGFRTLAQCNWDRVREALLSHLPLGTEAPALLSRPAA